ncbi:lysozyme [Thauera sp. 2A1]|uniref:lysozyme n=1 Tax=Thauera sp. 2A1 TaxID=2570191 RepID=UPI00188490FB|nr:lysozyme [Thauera sp. 2A1]KAI5914588.1 lysozyme [Thauera sp. 2A1]
MQLPKRDLPWPIAWEGVAEIARSEGCRLTAYRDVVGVPTIGWGRTRDVVMGMKQTQAEADADLLHELQVLADEVRACLTQPASASELGAMVSLAYNIGMGWRGTKRPKGAKDGFRQSTVLRAHNHGDRAAAARAFALWNKAGGQVVNGLVARRAREAALYLTPAADDLNAAAALARSWGAGVPEALEPSAPATPEAEAESTLKRSPIAQSGVVSIATGVLAAASGLSSELRQVADGLGVNPLLVVAAVALGVGAVVIAQRWKQRREGWA